MKLREHGCVAMLVAMVMALCCVFDAVACNCHADDDDSAANPCAVECSCCGIGASKMLSDGNFSKAPLLPAQAGLTFCDKSLRGRMAESLIFTPPRA
jgi:hypothetical protein